MTGMTIVQAANFVTPTSGGLRTALEHLATGYAAQGHRVVRVVPGPRDETIETSWGSTVFLRAPEVPGTGYRVLPHDRRVLAALDRIAPDRLEVHDRTTLRGLGRWARGAGVPSLVVSHERLDRWLRQWVSPRLPVDRLADRANAALAASYDTVVCTTAWAAQEFERLGVAHLRRVPLGVDATLFDPRGHDPVLRRCYAAEDEVLLLVVSRLSREKRVDLAIGAVAELRRRRVPVRLVIAGDGPDRLALEEQARDLPVHLLGHVRDRSLLARLMASADVMVAPGPVETFGLAALEAMASGTPVVCNAHSALTEVVASSGTAAASSPWTFADGVERLLALPPELRRAAARSRAEELPWSASVEGFLAVHRLPVRRTADGPARARVLA